MNRLVLIIIIFAIMSSLCIYEGIFINNTFDYINCESEKIILKMDESKDNIDTQEIIEEVELLMEYWDKKKEIVQIFLPHVQAAYFTDKLESLKAHVLQNDYNMANLSAILILSGCEMIQDQSMVQFHNIF